MLLSPPSVMFICRPSLGCVGHIARDFLSVATSRRRLATFSDNSRKSARGNDPSQQMSVLHSNGTGAKAIAEVMKRRLGEGLEDAFS